MVYTESFWESDSFLKSSDLIIVGAGIVGLMSALFYKKKHPDHRVLVLERGFLPQGASTRNAGFACVGSISEHVADTEIESEANVKKRIKLRYEGLRLLRNTLGDDIIGFEACGGCELFTSEKAFRNIAGKIDLFNRWMSELTDEQDVYREHSINGYPVIYNRLEGALHPGKMMMELVRRVSELGVEIKWNSDVSEVKSNGAVVLANGPGLAAGKILVAANGFVQKLLPGVEVKPARGFVFVTGELDEIPWKGIYHHDRGYLYFRNVNNRLLVGGARNLAVEEETTDQFGNNQKIKDYLVNFANEVLKLPEGWTIEYEWSGIMGFTPTKSPVVQQVDQNLYVASGLSGMGIAIGSEIGRRAADLLSEKKPNF